MGVRQGTSAARRVQWLLLALTLAFIWGHSGVPIAGSAAESSYVTRLLMPLLETFIGSGNVTDHLMRKMAHFTEFAVLGAQLLPLWRSRTLKGVVRSIECGFFAAFLDESIQLLSGRGARIIDVWLDVGGVAFGVALVFVISQIKKNSTRN